MLLTLLMILKETAETTAENPPIYQDFWLSWGVTLLVCIFLPLGYSWRDFFNKIILETWIEDVTEDGRKIIRREMSLIGTFIKTEFDQSRNLYQIVLRHNMKKRIIYSEYSLDEYLSHFLLRKYLFIIYAIDGYLFERKSNQKHIEQHYTRAGKLYLFFKAIYSIRNSNEKTNIMGIFMSFLLTGIIGCAPFNFDFIVFLISGFLGVIIAIVNTILWERGIIKLKKVKEETETELFLMPKAPKHQIIETYLVTGKELITQEKSDKPEKEWVDFEKTVKSFNELQKIAQSDLYKEIKYIKTDEQKILRSPEEIKSSRHNALYQMRYLYNQLLGAKENNRRLQKDNRNLWDRLAYLRESMDRERRSFAMDILLEQQRTGKTFKEIIKQLTGDQQVDLKWDKVVERALNRIESMKEEKRLEKQELITQLLFKIVENMARIGNGAINLEIQNILKQLEINKEENFFGEIKKSEQKPIEQNGS